MRGCWPLPCSPLPPAFAADLGYPTNFGPPAAPIAQSPSSFLSEVRLGTFAHDPLSPEKGSADLNGEILFAKPFSAPGSAWDFLLPRPSIGATLNFAGKTSQAYAGLTWTYDITKSIFVEGSFGGSVNNGKTGTIVPPGHNAMGCNASFREIRLGGLQVHRELEPHGHDRAHVECRLVHAEPRPHQLWRAHRLQLLSGSTAAAASLAS